MPDIYAALSIRPKAPLCASADADKPKVSSVLLLVNAALLEMER